MSYTAATPYVFSSHVHQHLIPYLAALHGSCISYDRMPGSFLPPLHHDKLLAWWKEKIADANNPYPTEYFTNNNSNSIIINGITTPSSPATGFSTTSTTPDPMMLMPMPVMSTRIPTARTIIILLDESGAPGGVRAKGSDLLGVVMLSMPIMETCPHVGFVESLLISPRHRGQGGARILMTALEIEAMQKGRTLLKLVTATGSQAEAVFKKFGYTEAGRIPNFYTSMNGQRKGETIFYKDINVVGRME